MLQLPGRGCSKWQYSYVGLLQFTDGEILEGSCSNSDYGSCGLAAAVSEGCSGVIEDVSFLAMACVNAARKLFAGWVGKQGAPVLPQACPLPLLTLEPSIMQFNTLVTE